MKKYVLEFGADRIEVEVKGKGGHITSDLKDGCEEPPETCDWCAAVDVIEALILAHAVAGVDVGSTCYKKGVEVILDVISNHN